VEKSREEEVKYPDWVPITVALCSGVFCGVVCAILVALIVVPYQRKKISNRYLQIDNEEETDEEKPQSEESSLLSPNHPSLVDSPPNPSFSLYFRFVSIDHFFLISESKIKNQKSKYHIIQKVERRVLGNFGWRSNHPENRSALQLPSNPHSHFWLLCSRKQ